MFIFVREKWSFHNMVLFAESGRSTRTTIVFITLGGTCGSSGSGQWRSMAKN